jgi:hypothetical protein
MKTNHRINLNGLDSGKRNNRSEDSHIKDETV